MPVKQNALQTVCIVYQMSLEVVLGPMFSGKSSYIHSVIRRRVAVGIPVLVVKPAIDDRYNGNHEVVTHDNARIPCVSLKSLEDLSLEMISSAEFLVIEEAQFFPEIDKHVLLLVESCKKDVLVVGLDGDSNRNPFGRILHCIPYADKVTKLTALCTCCRNGTPAPFTHRKVSDSNQVHVGGASDYEPLCRSCFKRMNESQ
jgi:thymidine kinase